MENVWLNEFVDAIAPFYSLWQCVRVSGAAININGGWFNIAMQMEVLETKPEVRSSSLASLDFLHYQFDYPLTGMRELILETLKNGFFTLGAAGSGTNEPFEERLAAWNQWNSQLQLRSLRQKNLQIHPQRHIHLRLRRR